jgi:peroxiredoxin (alkyl hydroperoxide reductase subunit C)
MPDRTLLPAGAKAPDFTLPISSDAVVRLSDLHGKPVVLVFYPADFSPVCTDELGVFDAIHEEFEAYGAQVVAISVDNIWSHLAFAKDRGLHFPLGSDFEPKGEIAKRYGAYLDDAGLAARALFVIDADGTIAWSYLSPIDRNPGAEGILAALESLKAKARSSPEARP